MRAILEGLAVASRYPADSACANGFAAPASPSELAAAREEQSDVEEKRRVGDCLSRGGGGGKGATVRVVALVTVVTDLLKASRSVTTVTRTRTLTAVEQGGVRRQGGDCERVLERSSRTSRGRGRRVIGGVGEGGQQEDRGENPVADLGEGGSVIGGIREGIPPPSLPTLQDLIPDLASATSTNPPLPPPSSRTCSASSRTSPRSFSPSRSPL